MTQLQFPDHVPYLTPNHIHKGWYSGPNGTHCLIGWANDTFKNTNTYHHVVDILLKEIKSKSVSLYPIDTVMRFNDSGNTSKRSICRVWNRAMKKLGYTEEV